MSTYPWQTKLIKYTFPDGQLIEEIRSPWDLYLEGRILQTTLGHPFHINLVQENKERIFSLRDENRNPICDIVTMPVDAKRDDGAWVNVRVLRTSSPMLVDNQPLIVLEAVEKYDCRVDKKLLPRIEEFFKAMGGELKEEHPSTFLKWKHNHKVKLPNLVVSSKPYDRDGEPYRAANLDELISLAEINTYDDIIFNVKDEFIKDAVDWLLHRPSYWPKGQWRFYGDHVGIQHYIKRVNTYKP